MARDLGLGRLAATALVLTLASLVVLAPAAPADTVGVPISVPGTVVFFGVACPTATSCEAVGDGGSGEVVVPIKDGIPRGPISVPGTHELKGIACESATSCIAVGNNADNVGVVVPITGTTPRVPISIPGTISIDGIACQSPTSCTAIGAATSLDGVVVPIAGTTPGAPVSVPGIGLDAVACQTATSCTAMGNSRTSFAALVLPMTNGTPGAAVTVPGGWSPGSGAIACQTAIDCTAVGINEGNFGVVVPIRDGAPGAPFKPKRYAAFFGVACESATTCEGVGQTGVGTQNGAVVPIRTGDPGFPIAAPGSFTRPSLNAVACGGATSCEVVGTSGYNGLVVASCTPAAAQGCAALSGHASSHHAIVADKVKCVGSSGQACVISEQLRTTGKRLVATKKITIRPGHTNRVALKLNRTGNRLLGKLGKLPVTLTISRAQGASPFIILDRSLTLRR